MKKFIILLLMVGLLTGCSEKKKDITTVKAAELIDMYEQDKTFMVYAGQGECDFCEEYATTLRLVIDTYDINVYYFNYDELDENESDVRRLINDYLYQLVWTPTTYIVEEGKTKKIISEKMSYTEVTNLLDEYGIIDK